MLILSHVSDSILQVLQVFIFRLAEDEPSPPGYLGLTGRLQTMQNHKRHLCFEKQLLDENTNIIISIHSTTILSDYFEGIFKYKGKKLPPKNKFIWHENILGGWRPSKGNHRKGGQLTYSDSQLSLQRHLPGGFWDRKCFFSNNVENIQS